MKPIRYAIADDHKIFRKGLRLILDDDKELECVGEAENGLQLLALLDMAPVDVILLDLKMPEMDGIEVTKNVRFKHPTTKIVILTMHDDEHYILHLMEAGANGYLIKNADPEEVKTAIHAVQTNGYYFNDHVSNIMLKTIMNKNAIAPSFNNSIKLTDKEKEVLKLICQEHTTAEIGEKIFLSPRTVEGIRAMLLEKIGVRNTAGLVIYALKNGIYEG
jgi:DNA-binding NarL/FixJ family response regulator